MLGHIAAVAILASLIVSAGTAAAPNKPKDPGVRAGPPGGGASVAGADPELFGQARHSFEAVESVRGTLDTAAGLGPRFNGTSCAGCHSYPVSGGSSPRQNPQFAMATAHGARNLMPAFLAPDGPVRIARLKLTAEGVSYGQVVPLFTITGRADAGACVLKQPDLSSAANISFRIPTPLFGGGLIENIPDSAILANQLGDARAKRALGIAGKPNRAEDGTISRFGWKAQNASLLFSAAEAYTLEIGTANEMFPYYGRENLSTECAALAYSPDDPTNYDQAYLQPPANLVRVTTFMRLLDQPKPASSFPGATTESIASGRKLFNSVGCALCHTPALTTTRSSPIAALNSVRAGLYSDLLLHQMGPKLADGIIQGAAGPDEFRTAPLWGLGQRIFFLHDGRTSDLPIAIREHKSGSGRSRSEASAVIDRFNALSPEQQQDVLNFLRSL